MRFVSLVGLLGTLTFGSHVAAGDPHAGSTAGYSGDPSANQMREMQEQFLQGFPENYLGEIPDGAPGSSPTTGLPEDVPSDYFKGLPMGLSGASVSPGSERNEMPDHQDIGSALRTGSRSSVDSRGSIRERRERMDRGLRGRSSGGPQSSGQRTISLTDAIRKVKSNTGGSIVGANESLDRRGRPVYRVRVLMPNGVVRTMQVPAQ